LLPNEPKPQPRPVDLLSASFPASFVSSQLRFQHHRLFRIDDKFATNSSQRRITLGQEKVSGTFDPILALGLSAGVAIA
jgi:hypothetical protein